MAKLGDYMDDFFPSRSIQSASWLTPSGKLVGSTDDHWIQAEEVLSLYEGREPSYSDPVKGNAVLNKVLKESCSFRLTPDSSGNLGIHNPYCNINSAQLRTLRDEGVDSDVYLEVNPYTEAAIKRALRGANFP